MKVTSRIRFELINGVSEREVKSAEYLIYAHECDVGIYMGFSKDPVKRWKEHVSDAFNSDSHNTDDKFREAIRGFRDTFKHYILATATFEKAARKKEAAAIAYYSQNLNVKPGSATHVDDGDLLPSSLTVFSLVMFITAEDDEHEKAIFRRTDHQHFEGSRSRPGGEGVVPQVQHF